jgi:hypothetical protein
MSLILRNTKGSSLSFTEMDNNLTYLEGLGFSGITTIPTLSQVLVSGNTTGANNIITSNGTKINAASGGGQLDLRYGGDNEVMLSNDSGDYSDEFLYLSPGYIELASYTTGSSLFMESQRAIGINGPVVTIGACTKIININSSNTFNTVNNVVALGAFGSTMTQSDRVYIANPVIKTLTAPTGSTDGTGVAGEIRYDNDYFYIKNSTGWTRTALTTW